MKVSSISLTQWKQRQSVVSIIYKLFVGLSLSHNKHISHTNNKIFIDPTRHSSIVRFKVRRGRKEAKPLSIGFPVGYIHNQHPQQSRWPAGREGGREVTAGI